MRHITALDNLTNLERDFTHASIRNDTVHGPFYTIRAPIFGGHYSSGRAELAGAPFALCVPWPIHLALDNLSTVKRLNDVLSSGCASPRRPWCLQKNGDIWDLVHAVLIWRKGAATTVVNWCKGHADRSHLHAGITDEFRLWGNNLADEEAEKAHGMISDCEDLCQAFYSRQKLYIDFVAAIHAMFVRVIRAEKILRDEHVAKLNKLVKLKLPHRDIALL